MQQQVIITDARESWMIEEDKQAVCLGCQYFRKCNSRHGWNCKVQGGTEIPKMRG